MSASGASRPVRGASQIVLGVSEGDFPPPRSLDKKLLTVGMETAMRDRSTRRSPSRQFRRAGSLESQREYKAQLDADKFLPVIVSRKPYERCVTALARGLIVGDQRDEATLKSEKIRDARLYMAQLDKDLASRIQLVKEESLQLRELTLEVSDVAESLVEPESSVDTRTTTVATHAQSFLSSPLKLLPAKPRLEDEDVTFFIGADERILKEKSKCMREKYRMQLNSDVRLAQSMHPEEPPKSPQKTYYVNRSGWTGIDVGGCASAFSNSTEELVLKRTNQQEYARLLDVQLQDGADTRERERALRTEAVHASAVVPYMRAD